MKTLSPKNYTVQKKIKTLIEKGVRQFQFPSLLYKNINPHVFPDKPTNSLRIEARLYGLRSELRHRNLSYNLGALYTLPHPSATKAYKHFIDYNPGNLGSWSDDISLTYNTTRLEYEVIHTVIDLFHGDQKKLSGYITSGGTEGNIYTLWLGRLQLEHVCKKDEICLLQTNLAHYSIRKAGHLCNVPQFYIPLNSDAWNIDVLGFKETIESLYKKGYRGYIVPLTLGYTSTGTCDNIEEITKEAKKLESKYKNIHFFFWIDAALNGLTAPFLDPHFQPFAAAAIQACVVDFHKFGLVPYPAGIILYQKSLKKLIEHHIDYLPETDTTLLGSRSGIPAISIWTMIHKLGKSGYRKLANEQKANKEYWIQHMTRMSQKILVLTHPQSISCGFIIKNRMNNRLPRWIEEKYYLYPGKTDLYFYPNQKREEIIYKIFFLPHVKRAVVEEFITDISRWV